MKRFTKEAVGISYLDHLLLKGDYKNAGQLCYKIFGQNKKLWEEEIFKFASVHQLRAVSPYIPQSPENRLDPQIYEMVLYEYLVLDAQVCEVWTIFSYFYLFRNSIAFRNIVCSETLTRFIYNILKKHQIFLVKPFILIYLSNTLYIKLQCISGFLKFSQRMESVSL